MTALKPSRTERLLLASLMYSLAAVSAPLHAQDDFSTSAAPEEMGTPAAIAAPESEAAPQSDASADAGDVSGETVPGATITTTTQVVETAESEAPDTATQTTTVVTEETTVTEVAQVPLNAQQPYVGALGHYFWLDNDWDADDAFGLQLLRGHPLGGSWLLESSLGVNLTENDTSADAQLNQYLAGIDLVRAFGNRTGFTPFVLAGIAGVYNDVAGDGRDDWGAQFNAGLGAVTKPLTEAGLRLRAEGRALHNTFQNDRNDYRVSLGVEYSIAGAPEAMAPLPVAEPPVQVVSTDISDSDGDGVGDPYDTCPDTPRGMEVDGRGCALPQVLTITGVVFEFDSARLTSDGRKILDEVAKKIIAYKNIPMELAGHTDSVGDDAYNQKLSELRANSVRDYLIAQGVAGDNLTAKGYGESQPVADNDTAAGRQLNRRVELRIEGQR